MSQRDLVAELRTARVEAPAEVRDRVRAIAADAPAPRSRFTWRHALVVAVPVAAAIAAAVVFTRPSSNPQATRTTIQAARTFGAPTHTARNYGATADKAAAIPFAPHRVERYGADLTLRVPTATGVSNAVKHALSIANALGGYPVSVHAHTYAHSASADLTLKVPREHVQRAITRLSALGTITAESVDIQDLQSGLNMTAGTIARLQKQLAKLRADNAPAEQIAAVTSRIASLQRAEAATRRTAHYATIGVHLATPPTGPAKHHHVWRDAAWAAAGAAALAALLLLARFVQRRREDALLSRR